MKYIFINLVSRWKLKLGNSILFHPIKFYKLMGKNIIKSKFVFSFCLSSIFQITIHTVYFVYSWFLFSSFLSLGRFLLLVEVFNEFLSFECFFNVLWICNYNWSLCLLIRFIFIIVMLFFLSSLSFFCGFSQILPSAA